MFEVPRRTCVSLILAIMVVLGVSGDGAAATREIEVDLKATERTDAPIAETVRLYEASHALVIGIDAYTGGWPRLSNAVKDAELVAAELTERGFSVRLAINLDASALRDTMRSFFAIEGSDPEARLLLWFAGHGETLDGEGFLVPADAPVSSDPLFKVKALHMRDFGGLVRLAASKHVLSVFDSCFSGTIFAARAGSPLAAITRKTILPVRQFVTSGDVGQLVSDDGSFRTLFLRALRGEAGADFNDDGYLTGDELGLYLSQEVSALTAAAQTPLYGKLQDVRYNQGDFVFVVSKGEGTALPDAGADRLSPRGDDYEALFWRSVMTSNDPAMFEAYLRRYPLGRFSEIARLKIKATRAQKPPRNRHGKKKPTPTDASKPDENPVQLARKTAEANAAHRRQYPQDGHYVGRLSRTWIEDITWNGMCREGDLDITVRDGQVSGGINIDFINDKLAAKIGFRLDLHGTVDKAGRTKDVKAGLYFRGLNFMTVRFEGTVTEGDWRDVLDQCGGEYKLTRVED